MNPEVRQGKNTVSAFHAKGPDIDTTPGPFVISKTPKGQNTATLQDSFI
ncbi:MAG: hypothetical protein LBT15_00780 [Synergistaceae bacterium]|jgi:hypothetical protein|nr:hypothetical protein [Synergistaceae bacterium]